MATNFSESFKKAMANTGTFVATAIANNVDERSAIVYAAEEETWTRSDNYLWYEEYADENISTIDDGKNIVVNSKQINLTQESNSQFIPFQMPRRYDNVDLMNMLITIHYANPNGDEYDVKPVNVSYNDEYIRFAWLVSKTATAISGTITFEVHATGVNSKGKEYVWKTRPNGKLTIEKSLSGNGVVEPEEDIIDTVTHVAITNDVIDEMFTV